MLDDGVVAPDEESLDKLILMKNRSGLTNDQVGDYEDLVEKMVNLGAKPNAENLKNAIKSGDVFTYNTFIEAGVEPDEYALQLAMTAPKNSATLFLGILSTFGGGTAEHINSAISRSKINKFK